MTTKKDFEDDRIILLNEVDESPISTAIQSLFTLAQKDKKTPINLIINTFGGSIYDMFALYDAIKYVQSLGTPVNTIGLGKIMSAGVILLVAGNTRKVGKNSTIMWHLGTDSIEGDMFELRNELNEVERLDDLCNHILCQETNMSKKDIENLLSSRVDVYVTPEQAIEYGMADSYLETTVTKHITDSKKTTSTRSKKTTKKTTKK